jgi:hypothetical protein
MGGDHWDDLFALALLLAIVLAAAYGLAQYGC